MRRLLALLAVVVLAGCLGPSAGPVGTDTPTASPTPTESPTGTPSPSPPPASPTTPSSPNPSNTVDYADLSADERAAFDAALDGQARFLPDSPAVPGDYFDPALLEPFREHDYVRKGDANYATALHEGALYASYDIYADPGSPDENASVVAYENLSANVSAPVRWAVENGSYHVPLGEWHSVPDELQDADFVRYEGGTYEMSYAVGDYWVTVMEARPVE